MAEAWKLPGGPGRNNTRRALLSPGASRVSDPGSATQLPGPWTSIWFAQPQPLTPSASIPVVWGVPHPAWSLWKQDKSTASCLLLSFLLSQRLVPGVSGELCRREQVRSGGAKDGGLPSRVSVTHVTSLNTCLITAPEMGALQPRKTRL